MNPPMNPNNFLIAMLDAYVYWLNVWVESERPTTDEGSRYTVADFANYHSHIRAIVPTGASSAFDRVLIEASVHDGDEGGPTDLTAWFDLDTNEGTNPLIAMVQGFDTNLQFIFRDGKFTNLP